MSLFLVIAVLFGWFIVPFIMNASKKMNVTMGVNAIALSLMLFFAGLAEASHVAGITGAYLAGLFISRTQYKNAVRIAPNDGTIHYNLGAAYSNKEDYKQAVTTYLKAVEFEPERGDAHSRSYRAFRYRNRPFNINHSLRHSGYRSGFRAAGHSSELRSRIRPGL